MMKRLNLLIGLLVILASCQLFSCGKGGNSPVDQYVAIIEESTKKAEKLSDMSELTNVQAVISPQELLQIVAENPDYELTDKDKEKLKKSIDKFIKVAYDKTMSIGEVPEEMRETMKQQCELMIEANNRGIDQAKTLSDLNRIR